MNVHWTESALADLDVIEIHIARHSAQYARGMIERIFARTDLLGRQPRIGPMVPEFEDEAIRELFEDPYRIVYRVNADRVDIVAVVHAARSMPKDFEAL